MERKIIALAGNPNVGKSTVFNALTGMRQHTGNWPGKTVDNAVGEFIHKNVIFQLVDLPGAYSLNSESPDEKVTAGYINSQEADLILIVADATCLERNLLLVREILSVTSDAVLCLNLTDEAARKGMITDTARLSSILGIPVIPTAARDRRGLDLLVKEIYRCCTAPAVAGHDYTSKTNTELPEASEIYRQCTTVSNEEPNVFDRKLDRVLTSRIWGLPIMLTMLFIVFWITMSGANYPSAALAYLFDITGKLLTDVLSETSLPEGCISFLTDGVYKSVSWVVSVMLPPMAIFFPLFTLLEDFGYLPRVAFNLDNSFRKCGAHGKQALTMCMGLGCNACGVTGCRIIESPRERVIAAVTNSFIPCNGRFPTLIMLIMIFFTAGMGAFSGAAAGLILVMFILLGIVVTMIYSKLLSSTLLKGIPSSFILELPPYRKPKVKDVIIRSILDRTIFVLGRALIVAAPAGAVIWILANIHAGDISLLDRFTGFLDPFGRFLGVDGVIIAAFILGFPANETVIPVMLMCYLSTGTLTEYSSISQLGDILADHGWTIHTALAVSVLCMFHFPCGTTCLTVQKETGSLKWTALAFILPALTGLLLCLIINIIFS